MLIRITISHSRLEVICAFETLCTIEIHLHIDGIWTPFGMVRPIQKI